LSHAGAKTLDLRSDPSNANQARIERAGTAARSLEELTEAKKENFDNTVYAANTATLAMAAGILTGHLTTSAPTRIRLLAEVGGDFVANNLASIDSRNQLLSPEMNLVNGAFALTGGLAPRGKTKITYAEAELHPSFNGNVIVITKFHPANKARLENRALLAQFESGNYNQYISYMEPETGTWRAAKVMGWTARGEKKYPEVLLDDGSTQTLDESRLSTAVESPSAGRVFENSGLFQKGRKKQYNLIKESKQPPIILESKAPAALFNPAPHQEAATGYDLRPGSLQKNITPAEKMSQAVYEKMRTFPIYEPASLRKSNASGFARSKAEVLLRSGEKHVGKVINFSVNEATGHVSTTGVHEIGHIQTDINIQNGIQDPGYIKYIGSEKSNTRLKAHGSDENFYAFYQRADEIRQHSRDVYLYVASQNKTSEVMGRFKKSQALPIIEVFGTGPRNFIQSMSNASYKLRGLETLNKRSQEYNRSAIEQLESWNNGRSGIISINVERTEKGVTVSSAEVALKDQVKVLIPVNTKKIPLTAEGKLDSKSQDEIYHLVRAYLESGLEMAEQQAAAIGRAKDALNYLKTHPNEKINQKQYFEFKDIFIKVHSTSKINNRSKPLNEPLNESSN